MENENIIPVLPLRGTVVFPQMVVPLFVGRDKSVQALETAMGKDKRILLVAQKDASEEDPDPDEIFQVGVVATVLQLLKLPDGTVRVLVEGGARAVITGYTRLDDALEAEIEPLEEPAYDEAEIEPLAQSIKGQFEAYVKLNKRISPDIIVSVTKLDDPSRLADAVAAHLNIKVVEKQKLLELTNVLHRLEGVYSQMEGEMSVLQVEKKIRNRVKRQMEKTQREYYLNEQMKAIQKELGENDEGKDEVGQLVTKIAETKLSKEAREKAEAEVKKLRQMPPMSAESTVVRNYLDWVLALPWGKKGKVKKDLIEAEKLLDTDHYGLEKVKERILEYLAVQKRTNKLKGPILCLVGPPGVGKTSLGKSIAEATGREFVRVSLGGVRDESEIRGHRRTYIGSMPGKIIQSMKKAKKSNPLFLLDEVDKMGQDFRGDPASALLEVLDPEQNNSFADHYLEVEYDLSDVMFITTANSLDMPQPLIDRMEIIRIAGYTEDEKTEIATRHLIPKLAKSHALNDGEWSISKDGILSLIRHYTKEAGVRGLERELARLIRKSVHALELDKVEAVDLNTDNLKDFAGVQKYHFGEIDDDDLIGVVTGLAWTSVGGDILKIEAVKMPGKGRMTPTGNLKDVMKESVSAAASYIRSRSVDFGIKPPIFETTDIHIHVPEGATPKDGPSAGVAMATAIVSVLTGLPVRRDIAMTGEISLRGRVLTIGGLKEKLLAATRAGTSAVLIPKENEKDLEEIPENVKEALTIIPVTTIDEVLAHALIGTLTPTEWNADEEASRVKALTAKAEDDNPAGVKH